MKILDGNLPKNASIRSIANDMFIFIPKGLFKMDKISMKEHLIEAKQITEENKHDLLGKAGWSTLGAIALGPAGLLAGLLLGGKRKEIYCACKLDTGEMFCLACTPVEYQWFVANQKEVVEKRHESGNSASSEIIAAIENIGKLKEQGILTEDEFEAKKAELLKRL